MPRSIRSRNLDLIRYLNHGHNVIAPRLSSIVNGTYLSKMATGDMHISDDHARRIESALNLPEGWLDRDNVGLLNSMTSQDIEVLQALAGLSPRAKKGLIEFIQE